MSRAQSTTVDDIFAFSDAQLDQFMRKHHRPDGSFELPIAGWDELSNVERDHLAKRLQSMQGAGSKSPTAANSRLLDLDRLDALLRGISSERNPAVQSQLVTERRTVSPPDECEVFIQDEMEAYNNLVSDGGRPLYKTCHLESVAMDPVASYEMLKPYWRLERTYPPEEKDMFESRAIFQRQWHRWQNFRKWQLDNRNIKEEDDGFLAYAEQMKCACQAIGDFEGVAEIESDPTCLMRLPYEWHHMQEDRRWQRRYLRETGCNDLSSYEDAVKARLSRHGFVRSFSIAKDPKQQDSLTTWIEYLGFEFWWLDRYNSIVQRLKPEHDKAWDELQQRKLVKHDESPEFVRTEASGTRSNVEKDSAYKALKRAEENAEEVHHKVQTSPNRLHIPKEQRVQMWATAQKTLEAAREALDFAKQRSDLITAFVCGTFKYVNAKEDAVFQRNLLDWAVQEASLIEAEQKSASTNRGSRKRKSAVFADDCSVSSRSRSKRRKSSPRGHGTEPRDEQVGSASERKLRPRGLSTTASSSRLDQDQGQGTQGTKSRSQPPVPNMTQGLRRSSRLATQSQSASTSRRAYSSSKLGSDYLSMDKVLAKRTRKRGRGHAVEYLVRFKGPDEAPDLWMAAKNLPKIATDAFDRLSGD